MSWELSHTPSHRVASLLSQSIGGIEGTSYFLTGKPVVRGQAVRLLTYQTVYAASRRHAVTLLPEYETLKTAIKVRTIW